MTLLLLASLVWLIYTLVDSNCGEHPDGYYLIDYGISMVFLTALLVSACQVLQHKASQRDGAEAGFISQLRRRVGPVY